MKKNKYQAIMSMRNIKDTYNGNFLRTPSYRNMLDNIHLGCYIESESTGQYGDVVKILNNKHGVPVCIKVSYENDDGKKHYDYISVDRISFYEPCSHSVSNDEYFDDENEI